MTEIKSLILGGKITELCSAIGFTFILFIAGVFSFGALIVVNDSIEEMNEFLLDCSENENIVACQQSESGTYFGEILIQEMEMTKIGWLVATFVSIMGMGVSFFWGLSVGFDLFSKVTQKESVKILTTL